MMYNKSVQFGQSLLISISLSITTGCTGGGGGETSSAPAGVISPSPSQTPSPSPSQTPSPSPSQTPSPSPSPSTVSTLLFSDFKMSVGQVSSLAASGGSGSYTYSLISGGAAARLSGSNLTADDVGSGIVRVSDGSTTVDANFTVKGAKSLYTTGSSSCVKVTDETIQCFGTYLGEGSDYIFGATASTLVKFNGAEMIAAMQTDSSYSTFACALINGVVYCNGHNQSGQLGNGTVNSSSTLVQPNISDPVIKIVAGRRHVCALTSLATGGKLYCWGRNYYGQIGVNSTATYFNTPQLVLSSAVDVSAGLEHTCSVASDGSVRCWGYNYDGQVGDGTSGINDEIRRQPVPVLNSSYGIVNVVTGRDHTCVLGSNGRVYCWGSNAWLQLGRSTIGLTQVNDATQSLQVENVTNVSKIVAGVEHTCALLTDKKVKCWGGNNWGQAGVGTSTSAEIAPASSSIAGVDDVSSGTYQTCVLQGQAMRCWGDGSFGRLGRSSSSGSALSPIISVNPWQ